MDRFRSLMRRCGLTFVALAVCGCAHYRPDPLPTAPDLQATPQLTAPARQFWLPGLAPHPVPAQGLDEVTVVTLAVFNNPDLKAARSQAGVAGAQLLAAGLLPDPQLDASFAKSALDYGGVLSLSEDIQALITRGAAKAAAKNAAQQVNLGILWQEWQVAEKARELFIHLRADQQLQTVFTSTKSLLEDRYQRDRTAMQRGDETAGVVAADLNAVTDADTSLRQLETEVNTNRHALNALLGLQPEAEIHLIGSASVPEITQEKFDQARSSLPRHRADLLALQAGYQSQEETLRRAVLAQFPAMSAGIELERDPVEGVNAMGPQVSMTLPLFNRNRGQIAIQKATRVVLRQTYQARLDAADSQADEVWKAIQIMQRQLKDLDAKLPLLEQTAKSARQSLEEYNVNAPLYISLESNVMAKRAEAIRLRASLESAQSALSTLLGLPL